MYITSFVACFRYAVGYVNSNTACGGCSQESQCLASSACVVYLSTKNWQYCRGSTRHWRLSGKTHLGAKALCCPKRRTEIPLLLGLTLATGVHTWSHYLVTVKTQSKEGKNLPCICHGIQDDTNTPIRRHAATEKWTGNMDLVWAVRNVSCCS